MQEFRYDASGSFRSWLFVVVRNTVLNYFRERRSLVSLDAIPIEPVYHAAEMDRDATHPFLEKTRRVQETVRARTSDKNWQIFWRTYIKGESLADVADSFKMKHPAAYMARHRVLWDLIEEGARQQDESCEEHG